MVVSAVVGALVGQEFISKTSEGIFNSIKGIFYHTNPIVTDILEDMDIYEELDLIKTFIQEINKQTVNDNSLDVNMDKIIIQDDYDMVINNNQNDVELSTHTPETEVTAEVTTEVTTDDNNNEHTGTFTSHTLTKCLIQLRDIVEKIYHEINEINRGVEYHKTIWFNKFRTPKYITNITHLKRYKRTMDSRFEHLLKIMNIYLRMDYKLFVSQK
jgi:hypothetical protein